MSRLIDGYNKLARYTQNEPLAAAHCDPSVAWVDVSRVAEYQEEYVKTNLGKLIVPDCPLPLSPMVLYCFSPNGAHRWVTCTTTADGASDFRVLSFGWAGHAKMVRWQIGWMWDHTTGHLVFVDTKQRSKVEQSAPYGGAATLASLALMFMTARNARLVDETPSRSQRRRLEVPSGVRFSHIEIDPLRSTKATHLDKGDSGLAPWHRVRGHWVSYSESRPLFGRSGLHGRFWVSEHERGDRKNGEVHKTYGIIPCDLDQLSA